MHNLHSSGIVETMYTYSGISKSNVALKSLRKNSTEALPHFFTGTLQQQWPGTQRVKR